MIENDPDSVSSFWIYLMTRFAGTLHERWDAFSGTGKREIAGFCTKCILGMAEVGFFRFLALRNNEQFAALWIRILLPIQWILRFSTHDQKRNCGTAPMRPSM